MNRQILSGVRKDARVARHREYLVPGSFFDDLERLLMRAPAPKTAAEKTELANARKTVRKVRTRTEKRYAADLKEARANAKALLSGKRTRKKAR